MRNKIIPVLTVQCFNCRLLGIKTESPSTVSTNASTPQSVSNVVHYLAMALFQIEQGIERRFLKAPLGKYLFLIQNISYILNAFELPFS